MPPLGGYKGAENQLYRVEVHTAGELGEATFKWSRDNASVQARVQTIPTLATLVVDSVGKDDVLRFNDGDWIEILDDQRELNGQPGVLRRIAIVGGVNDSTRTITLAEPLLAGDFPVNADDEPTGTHTRIKRWDQAHVVKRADGTTYTDLDAGGATGEIEIPADGTQLLLESGILVTFGVSVANGRFRTGDYWVFAARTNDASVEILDAAPPRGIHHHYAKLAVITADDEADDCREDWPPDTGCCTVVVQPGESIQGALDSLPPQGGCVCLKSGIHEIDEPIQIAHSNIMLHGEAPGTRIVTTAPMQYMLFLSGEALIENVEIAHITFDYASDPNDFDNTMILGLFVCTRVNVHHCELLYTGENLDVLIAGAGVSGGADVTLDGNRLDRVVTGIWADTAPGLIFENNTLRGMLHDSPGGPLVYSWRGVWLQDGTDARIADNRFQDFIIAVFAQNEHVEITGNEILRLALPADLDQPGSAAELIFAIDLRSVLPSRVCGNRIELASQGYGGVYLVSQGAEVSGNVFRSTFGTPSLVGPIGVYAGDFSDDPTGAGDRASIALNRFTGRQLAIGIRNSEGVHVNDNTITGEERSVTGVMMLDAVGAVVADNVLRDLTIAFSIEGGADNRFIDNTASELMLGTFANGGRNLEFQGNSFADLTNMGIGVLNPETSARFENTRVANCGYGAGGFALGLGVLQSDPFVLTDLTITNCEILNTGVSPDAQQLTAGVAWGIVSLLASHVKLADNRVAHALDSQLPVNREHRALWMVGMPALTIPLGQEEITFDFGAASVTDNVFQGPSLTRLVDVRAIPIFANDNFSIDLRFRKLTFSGNHCDHVGDANDAIRTVDVFATRMVVTGNQVNTPPAGFSFGFGGRDFVAAMSNHSTRSYINVGSTVPAPLLNFNVVIP